MVVLIGFVGLQASGKTTFAKEIAGEFGLNYVRTDSIRDFLIKNITYYHAADYSYHNPLIDSANKIVTTVCDDIIRELLSQEQSLILDSCGNKKTKRKVRFDKAKTNCPNLKIIIIYVKADEKSVLLRLKERDRKTKQKWVQNYESFWKKNYEVPDKNEADYLLVYDGKNKQQIIDQVAEIINS